VLRLSEVYQSIQGEGPRAGVPTTFVRFAGCNLKCPGWPCDTPHAIDPRIFEKEQELLTVDQLLERIPEWPRNVCLTGGEPFLQKNDELKDLTEKLWQRQQNVEVFTNGTLEYPDWAINDIDFIMDWKLPGSGEAGVNIGNRLKNLRRLKYEDMIKFVIKDRNDYLEAKEVYGRYKGETDALWSFGVVWGALENAELIEWVLRDKLDWRLNLQVHNYIWDRDKRGI